METDWSRIRDLFEHAMDLSPGDVRDLLQREAGSDPRTRDEVISLLRHHHAAGAFLMEPAALTADATDVPPLEPGHVIGPYTIVAEAGHGGMGRVYKATDTRLGRTVALKAVRTSADRAERERLRHEARAAARLSHPGICTVYALEEAEGDLYIASEFVEGRTLRQEMTDGRRPSASELLQFAQEVAGALASAHEAGITHGDLKPENIMRAHNGRLKILDFGLARVEFVAGPDGHGGPDGDAGHAEARAGLVAGTPGYMAPEQLSGGPRSIRGDVFSFGVMLYEYASGTHPFLAPTALGMSSLVRESEPAPITTVRSDVPAAIGRVIDRCLRKAAADRYSSAGQIVEVLAGGRLESPHGDVARWWRVHQLVVTGMYLAAAAAAWGVRALHGGTTTWVFLAVGVAATVAAVFRGHLLFTERVNSPRFAAERRRAAPVTMATDLLVAVALFTDGVVIAGESSLSAVLIVALGVCLALARLLLEPSTTTAAFADPGR